MLPFNDLDLSCEKKYVLEQETVFQSYQDDYERLCALEPCLQLKRSPLQVGFKPGLLNQLASA